MLSRIVIAGIFTIGLASTAYANCDCSPQTAHSVAQDNGVTVMRGNIPKLQSTKWGLIADRKAAEKRAEVAERRARSAERDASNARAELAARPADTGRNYGYNLNRQPRYIIGNYRYGASVSRSGFGGRGINVGRGVRGGKGISRPVFTRRIRS